MATLRLTSNSVTTFDNAPVYPEEAKETDSVHAAVTRVKSHFREMLQL